MAEQLALHRKRRGVVRASLTRLNTKLAELEATTGAPDTPAVAQTLATRLKTLDAEFRNHHLAIVDATEGEEALAAEQDALDTHDDNISLMSVRINKLISTPDSTPKTDPKKLSLKRLTRLSEKLTSIKESVSAAADGIADICKLQQHREQITEMQEEFKEIRSNLLSFDMEPADPLVKAQTDVEEGIFDCSLTIKKRLHPKSESTSSTAPDASGVKLPKLEVPTFDGDILNWQNFWEQFEVSIHSRSNLTSAEKLVYLQGSLKDSTSKRTIDGLTKSGEHYEEAVQCLKERYDRPRLVHQRHVRTILDAPPLKEGNGKEIRVLHDTVVQHLRALKAMGPEPSNSFITSLIELKLDVNTMFEWQRYSQEDADVPEYQKLLGFLKLRAQASEASGGTDKRVKGHSQPQPTSKNWKGTAHKQVNSFATSANPTQSDGLCIACKSEKHPLYACTKFRSLSHDCMISLLKSNGHCLNCLRPGHFLKDCKSLHHCKQCQKPHHTLLHVEAKPESISKTNDST